MIAKRFTSERLGLTERDAPDFPWFRPAMVDYRGTCSHEIHSWLERRRGERRVRTAYVARVHYNVITNKWSLEDWRETKG